MFAAEKTTLSIGGPFGMGLTAEGDNLILRALTAAKAEPQYVTLEKHLPVSAGIGGGSANAAAVLRMCGVDDLHIAVSLGADVPVCLRSETAHMTGIGEDVTLMPGLGQLHALLVNPRVAVSTGAIFKAFDAAPDIRETPRPMKTSGDLLSRALDGRNDLEPIAMAQAPVIGDVLRGRRLRDYGLRGRDVLPAIRYWRRTAFSFDTRFCDRCNGVNFMDGANGFMGSFMLIASLALMMLAMTLGAMTAAILAGALCFGLLGFLPYNFRRNAEIFCGDVGSLLAGFIFAIASLMLVKEVPELPLLYVGPILLLPFLADILMTLGSRAKRRENIFAAHSTHLYQRLIRSGWSHAKVSFAYAGAGLLCANIAVFAVFNGVIGSLWMLLLLAFLAGVLKVWAERRL